MSVTTVELTLANEAARALLDQIGLAAYLFEVEPREGGWLLRLDCALAEGWQSLTIPLDKDKLLISLDSATARAELLEHWRARMGACKTG